MIEIDYDQLEGLAAIQCTDEEMAAVLRISVDTFTRRKQDDPEFQTRLAEGKARGRQSLRRVQWEAAQEGNATMMIWLGKQTLGQKDRAELTGAEGGPMKVQIEIMGAPPQQPRVQSEGRSAIGLAVERSAIAIDIMRPNGR
jgi:hypothetical protein